MMELKHLLKDIDHNVHEAREKMIKAYRMRDTNKVIADWQRDMAKGHMDYNVRANELAGKMMNDVAISQDKLAPGLLEAYRDWHGDIMEETAKVNAMIAAYK